MTPVHTTPTPRPPEPAGGEKVPDHTDRHNPLQPDAASSLDGRGDNIVPLHRPKKRPRITVEQVETEQMTPDEYNQAVTVFATLINQWKSPTSTPECDGEIAA